jgi:hypothetical protein
VSSTVDALFVASRRSSRPEWREMLGALFLKNPSLSRLIRKDLSYSRNGLTPVWARAHTFVLLILMA